MRNVEDIHHLAPGLLALVPGPGFKGGLARHLGSEGMAMTTETPTGSVQFDVVVNGEEQYSIWPIGKKLPAAWRHAGFSGSRQECLDHIREVWVDMRPLSLRR
jgi:MbtH protein